MTLTDAQKSDFTNDYLQFLVRTWTEDAFAALAESDPRAALAEAGIQVPADAEIEIVRHETEQGAEITHGGDNNAAMDAQIALYEQGLESGRFRFHVPGAPDLTTEQLDSYELSAVSGGFEPCCCCCCC